tara:strand:+ start:166 stop:333 length:168 start_codon:yes stop_codon:yes gene_type:complete
LLVVVQVFTSLQELVMVELVVEVLQRILAMENVELMALVVVEQVEQEVDKVVLVL